MIDSDFKDNELSNSFDDDLQKLIDNVNELSDLYNGKDIEFLFNDIVFQNEKILLLSLVFNN